MRRTLISALAACAVTLTTSAGAVTLDDAYAKAQHYGFTLDTSPPDWVQDDLEAKNQWGWADTDDAMLYVRSGLTYTQTLQTAFHEIGHARWFVSIMPRPGVASSWWRTVRKIYHGTADHVEEDYAETYGWCVARLDGIGYTFSSWADPVVPTSSQCGQI